MNRQILLDKIQNVLEAKEQDQQFNNELVGAVCNSECISSIMGKACQYGNEKEIKAQFISLLVEIQPDSLQEAQFILDVIKEANKW